MKTIAVTSGKGGVGKSTLSANLGVALASKGQRVLLFDADLGLANLDVVLGANAQYGLQHAIGGPMSLSEVIADGPGGVRLIAGGSGIGKLNNISRKRLQEFLMQVSQLENETDVLIFDTGSGIDKKIMTFLRASDIVLLVTTPDPSSVTDAYATAKTLFRLRPTANVRIVMNMVTNAAQADSVYQVIRSIVQKFVHKEVAYAGCVRQDPIAVQWNRKRVPFVLGDPKIAASRDVLALAQGLMEQSWTQTHESLLNRLNSAFGVEADQAA